MYIVIDANYKGTSVRLFYVRWLGIFFAIPFCVVLGYWVYKRMGIKNFDTILESQEELKEIEEEPDTP